MAFPFHAMRDEGAYWTAAFDYAGAGAVVLWDTARQAAVAVRPVAAGSVLTFQIDDGGFVDNETGSRWSVTGLATEGPLEGEQLEIVADAYVAFWFPWAAFHPGTDLFIE